MNILPHDTYEKALEAALGSRLNEAPLTDLDAARFIKKTLDSLKLTATFCNGDWYRWNGIVHERTGVEVDESIAVAFVDAYATMVDQAHKLGAKEDDLKPYRAKVGVWSSHTGLTNLKARLRATYRVEPAHFARNRDWLVMNNGWVYGTDDLSTPLAPSPERPVTRHLGVGLSVASEGASWEDLLTVADQVEAPRWQGWLDEFIPLKEDQDYLQEAVGAALLGGGRARNIPHLVGPPGTGKSTFLNIMSLVFGHRTQCGYAGALSKEAIVKRSGSNFLQAEAKDARFLFLSEPSTDRTDDSFLKNLAGGGEAIVTERKNRDPEEWRAECVLFIAANSVIRFATWDDALVERVNIVHFNTRVQHMNPNFDTDLVAAEGAGILAWILEGAERYVERGFIYVPEAIRERGSMNVVESSNVLRWLTEQEDWTVDRSGLTTVSTCVLQSEAFKAYQEWCFDSGEKARAKAQFVETVHHYTHLPEGKNVRSDGTRLFGVLMTPLRVNTPSGVVEYPAA